MHRAERIALYTLVGAACLLSAQAGGVLFLATPARGAPAPGAAEPPISRLATCDTFGLVSRLMETEAYFGPRKQEEERLKAMLTPLEAPLRALEAELQGADPSKPENQAKAREFQIKREEYQNLSKQAQAQFAQVAAKQFADAYEKIQAAAGKIAKAQGYTHVASQRTGKIRPVGDAAKIAEEFLSRPYTVQPEGSDLTEAIRVELNLPEKPVVDSPLLDKGTELKTGEVRPSEPKPAPKK